jgi:uncharacterized membrane protein
MSCCFAGSGNDGVKSSGRKKEKEPKDYMINLKSELEIRMLHEKLDHLIMHQQEELIEIQKSTNRNDILITHQQINS